MTDKKEFSELVIVPYIGGSSKDSTEAIIDLLSQGDKLERARLLSSPADKENGTRHHGFFLSFEHLGYFIVPRGYASGYGGTGPNQLSNALMIFESYDVDAREIILETEVFERLEYQCLTHDDFDKITEPRDSQCGNSSDYILDHTWDRYTRNAILSGYSPRLPLSLLHPSIQPLKSLIFSAPEDALRRAYVILESKVRKLSGLKLHGTKLFDEALKPRIGTLQLIDGEDEGEQAGVQNFLKGLFQLHRNPLMHRDLDKDSVGIHNAISEFLVINHALGLCDSLEVRPVKKEIEQRK